MFVSLPSRQGAGRMRIWRGLRALGCVALRDGVYLLPEAAGHAAALAAMADEVVNDGGRADIYRLSGRDARQQAELLALFERGDEYSALLKAADAASAGDGKALRALRRELARIAAIDFFPGEAQRQARAALAALEAASSGEPVARDGAIRRLASADFQNRTWATREHLWVDRMASAWLIRRFIDRKARFLWLDNPRKCPKTALGFDFDGATFTHVGGRVSFEVLAASFGLDADPALTRIASIVHCLDVGGVPVAEAAGIEAVLAGLRAASGDDDTLLTAAARVFDGLYHHYQQEPGNG